MFELLQGETCGRVGGGRWRNVASKASVVGDVKVLRYETVACRARVVEQGEGVVVGSGDGSDRSSGGLKA